MEEIIQLVSSDGKIFDVLASVAFTSSAIKDSSEQTTGGPVPVYDVDGQTLEWVIEYCMAHKDDTVPAPVLVEEKNGLIPDKPIEVSSADTAFCDSKDRVEMFRLINAANKLDITALFNLCAHAIAARLYGKSEKESLEYFEIDLNEPLKEAELEAVRTENPWVN